MSITEPPTTCFCQKPDCYFCWLRNKVWNTTAEKPMRNSDDDSELSAILSDVCMAAGVSVEDVRGESRVGKILRARQMYCYVTRKQELTPGVSQWYLREIGSVINRDHSTVIHSCEVVENMLKTKHKEYEKVINKLITQFPNLQ